MANQTTTWNKINNALFTLLFIIFWFRPGVFPIIIAAGLFSFIIYWLLNVQHLKKLKPFAGYANLITLFRLLIVIFIGFFHNQLTHNFIFSLALFSVILDGVDGYIARKFNQTTTFGEIFDKETDAFYVLIITSILYMQGLFGFWLIIIGYFRYFYGIIVLLKKGLTRDSIRARFQTIMAGIFFVAILSPFILPSAIHYPVVITAGLLIVLSFLNSFVMIFLSHEH